MKDQMTLIRAALEADQPVCAWSEPGCGKTAAVEELAQEMGAHLEVLIGSTLDPTDVARPIIDTDSTVKLVAAPAFHRASQAVSRGQMTIIFLDEMGSTPASVQAALLRAVNERQIGDTSLKGVRFLAAANPIEQAAGGFDQSPAMANRWLHLPWSVSAEDWSVGEMTGWGQHRTDAHVEASSLVSSWIMNRPTTLLDCPKEVDKAQRGWPSPRAWTRVAKMLSCLGGETVRAAALSPVGYLAVNGLVGEVVGREFLHWVADQDLPHPKDLLAGTASLPERADRARAAVESAISYSIAHELHPDEVYRLLSKTRADLQVSLGILYVKAASKTDLDISQSKGFSAIAERVVAAAAVGATARVRYQRKRA